MVQSKYGSQLNVNRPDILVDVSPVRRKHCVNILKNVTGIYETVDYNHQSIHIKVFVFWRTEKFVTFFLFIYLEVKIFFQEKHCSDLCNGRTFS